MQIGNGTKGAPISFFNPICAGPEKALDTTSLHLEVGKPLRKVGDKVSRAVEMGPPTRQDMAF
jgi:hypothetical protein